jgi:hypothetical protein
MPTPPANSLKSIRLPTIRKLSVEEWIAVRPNPRQRDTDRHLLRAVHLRQPNPTHLQVNAAVLPDGTLIKLDGHSRARLWQLEPDIAPARVLVGLYPVNTVEEDAELYSSFDNRAAVDTASDDLSGAFRAVGFVPASQLFREYKGTGSIKGATVYMMGLEGGGGNNALDIYDIVPRWIEELRLLDSLRVTAQRFSNPILIAALLTIRRRGNDAVEVWDRYQRDLGIKTGTEMDGVEALTRLLLNFPQAGGNATKAMVGKAVSCIEAAIEDRVFVSQPRTTIVARYCTGMRHEMEKFADLFDGLSRKRAEARRTREALRSLAADHQHALH